jgi:RIO kinase 1
VRGDSLARINKVQGCMKIPNRIQPLVDDGLIDDVVRRLKSGKEADVYTVLCGEEIRCAKVYKEATQRSFKQAVQYQEGRKVRNSRSARAMQKGSKFGRKQQEETWQTAEVDALFRLANAGVRVPQPYICLDGVLLMELITDGEGLVAPRLSDVIFTEQEAIEGHDIMIRNIVRMLCAGIVHGDLSTCCLTHRGRLSLTCRRPLMPQPITMPNLCSSVT